MEFFDRVRRTFARRGFPARIQPLSQKYRKASARVAFVTLGILFAVRAQELAKAQAQEEWQQKHRPSPQLWRKVFESHSWKAIEDLRILESVYRVIGPQLDLADSGAALVSADESWVAIRNTENEQTGIPFALFSNHPIVKKKQPIPSDWKATGRHWEALERIGRLLSAKRSPDNRRLARGNAQKPDLREIRY